ncbi:hypothetical protein AB0J14_31335 [Micromonospora arborensis]|uniref:hypothetical protein n=1 Tax=Micromonospora arborensis TaxID=2116518 RepID=UPI0033DDDB4C
MSSTSMAGASRPALRQRSASGAARPASGYSTSDVRPPVDCARSRFCSINSPTVRAIDRDRYAPTPPRV